jgi:hypothetical protein
MKSSGGCRGSTGDAGRRGPKRAPTDLGADADRPGEERERHDADDELQHGVRVGSSGSAPSVAATAKDAPIGIHVFIGGAETIVLLWPIGTRCAPSRRAPGREESTTVRQAGLQGEGKALRVGEPDSAAEERLGGARGSRRARALRRDDARPLLPDAALPRAPDPPRPHGADLAEELAERIEDSWLLRAPKRLVDAYVAEGA